VSAATRRSIAARYRRFAEIEAPGRSRLYVETAEAVSRSEPVLDFLAAMPPAKWQPNLLFGVVRYLYGTPSTAEQFVATVLRHADDIAVTMAVRSTQTNEPARCATLLPVLAGLPQPLALLEVGAAAGLCLLPDYYAYDYGTVRIAPSATTSLTAPVFECRASANTPLPTRNLDVVWRAGLDLQPVDLHDEAEVRWLEALVWPGEEYRLPRLRAACEIARAHPPLVTRGDLRSDVVRLAQQAPAEATLVIFHTAVLAYVRAEEERKTFARSVRQTGAVWLANEGPGLIPGVPSSALRESPGRDAFLLCVDGKPTAWTDGHGTWIDWRGQGRPEDPGQPRVTP
jgi:hypothetical protein